MYRTNPTTLISACALFLLAACGERAIVTARQEGTIEAWEAVLESSPGVADEGEAIAQLGSLMLVKAHESSDKADFQSILNDSRLAGRTRVLNEAAASLELLSFKSASRGDSLEEWDAYLSEHRNADKTRTIKAEQAVLHLTYKEMLEISTPEMERVSVQDPLGDRYWPNGWRFKTMIRNVSDKTITDLKLHVVFLSEDGQVLDTMGVGKDYFRHWAVVDLSEVDSGRRKKMDFQQANPMVPWKPRTEALGTSMLVEWMDYTRTVPPGWQGDYEIRIRTIEFNGKK